VNERTRVLVVDDSAFARKVVRELLERSGSFEVVGIACDGLEALEAIAALSPDVITLDLVMPELDGLGVLDALGQNENAPRVVVVSVSGADTQLGAAALMKGAIDIVEKPSSLATERLYEMGDELVVKVRAAASARRVEPRMHERTVSPDTSSPFRLIAIGASTGGPRAVGNLISSLPPDLPVPVVVAIHIPHGYTKALADRIATTARMPVIEGENGAVLQPGTAVIVPGGRQSEVVASHDGLLLAVSKSTEPGHFKPSIDVLFDSAARVASPVLGAVLTGMGNDGTAGARAIAEAGGAIVTESEESCVVYGMPRAVRDAGLSEAEVPIEKMAAWLVGRLARS
jgi:two-component system chemotaxis response regulator CheB